MTSLKLLPRSLLTHFYTQKPFPNWILGSSHWSWITHFGNAIASRFLEGSSCSRNLRGWSICIRLIRNQVFQGCLAEDHSLVQTTQDSHSSNGKPPGLEEDQPTTNTLPCGKPPEPPIETETVKDKETLQSWILRSHVHQGRRHCADCYRYLQQNQPTVSELDGDIKVKPESIDKILETMKSMPSSEGNVVLSFEQWKG